MANGIPIENNNMHLNQIVIQLHLRQNGKVRLQILEEKLHWVWNRFLFSKGWNGLLLVLLVVIVVTLPIFQAAAYDSHNESC